MTTRITLPTGWTEIPAAIAAAMRCEEGEHGQGWTPIASFTDMGGRYGPPTIETTWSRPAMIDDVRVEWRLWVATTGARAPDGDPTATVWGSPRWRLALAWPGHDVGEVPEDDDATTGGHDPAEVVAHG